MKITTEYSEAELHEGICRSCSEKTLVCSADYVGQQVAEMCPDCIEAIKFEEATGL